jgi:hypothetical protein
VLDGLKYLEVPTLMEGMGSTLHMEIDSYINTPGKQIIFLGRKYCLVLNRHNYQLFLNDASFDPLSLNITNINDVINNSTDSTSDSTSDSTDNNSETPSLRSIFRSEDVKPKRIHHTVEGKKRHIHGHGEGDVSQDYATLSGRGTIPVSATSRASNNNLNYHGGTVVTNGKVIPIVWYDTTNGNFNAANLKTCYNSLPTFYNDLLKTKLFTTLTPGKKGSDPQSKITSIDSNVHYLVPDSSRRKKTLSDSDISAQLNSWLNIAYDASKPNSTIPKNTSSKLSYMYMIFFPSGIKLSSGFCSSYCGFHTYTNGYIYAVLPWVGDCMGSCGMSSYVSSFGGSTCGSLHSVASHEMTEMATDPYFNGYYDSYGWENADKCAWTSPACYKNFQTGNSYCVQQAWNHTASSSSGYDAGCTKNFQN